MRQNAQRRTWVAVRVERGFPAEARGFSRRSDAERQERVWRRRMNPDYDETGVLELDRGAGGEAGSPLEGVLPKSA